MKNRILVIGDVMIDTYIYGKVGRVSPEAPVPVVTPQKTINCLGGAGNVARNAAALGADVSVVYCFGNDENGDIIVEKLKEWNIDCRFIIRDDSVSTINKTRIVGNDQQIVRIDYNDKCLLNDFLKRQLRENVVSAIQNTDIIIISDYGKGICDDDICNYIIKSAEKRPVIVDPKGTNWDKYKGATVITPNLKEINLFSGKDVHNENDAIEKNYADFDIGVKYLLLTRSEEGMSLIGNNLIEHISAFSHDVFDVSGAGDTVVAALAVYMNKDLHNIVEATHIANIAAGLVVVKPGTAVVTEDEIRRQIEINRKQSRHSKIYSLSEYDKVEKLVKFWRTAGNTLVTANGCFDILHRGHIKLLTEAKTHGDKLIVLINSDASVKRLKGEERPINGENDRAYVVSSLEAVDAVVIFDPAEMPISLQSEEINQFSRKARNIFQEAPMAIMRLISPDVHVKGGDYKKEDIPEGLYAKNIVIVKVEDGYSTTKTISKMKR